MRAASKHKDGRILSLGVSCDAREAKEPSRQGGDFFAFVQQRDGSLTIVVGDASAKTSEGRLHAHVLKRAFRMAALEYVNPSCILSGMSRGFVRAARVQPPAEQFASAFVARIDTLAGRLDYASAGTEGAMLFRCLTTHEHLIATGPLLGMQSRPYYGERSTHFAPGNLLVAYTDGVIEARSTHDATFLGTCGLAKLVHNVLRLSLSPQHGNLIARLDEYAGGVYNDDATLVCVTASEATRSLKCSSKH